MAFLDHKPCKDQTLQKLAPKPPHCQSQISAHRCRRNPLRNDSRSETVVAAGRTQLHPQMHVFAGQALRSLVLDDSAIQIHAFPGSHTIGWKQTRNPRTAKRIKSRMLRGLFYSADKFMQRSTNSLSGENFRRGAQGEFFPYADDYDPYSVPSCGASMYFVPDAQMPTHSAERHPHISSLDL